MAIKSRTNSGFSSINANKMIKISTKIISMKAAFSKRIACLIKM